MTALGPKDAGSYATLAAGMIVLTGLIFVVAGLLKLGFITAFLSRPVMEGFVFGLAIFVTVSQLPKLFGLKKVLATRSASSATCWDTSGAPASSPSRSGWWPWSCCSRWNGSCRGCPAG